MSAMRPISIRVAMGMTCAVWFTSASGIQNAPTARMAAAAEPSNPLRKRPGCGPAARRAAWTCSNAAIMSRSEVSSVSSASSPGA